MEEIDTLLSTLTGRITSFVGKPETTAYAPVHRREIYRQ